jgi:ATP-dependent DNA ligase
MSLEVPLTLEPMEADAVDTLPPASKGWQYEPKVDGEHAAGEADCGLGR